MADLPDWTTLVGGQTREGKVGYSQVAAPVWFEDTFDSSFLKWSEYGDGSLTIIAPTSPAAAASKLFESDGAMYILTDAGLQAGAYKRVPATLGTGMIGLECTFMLHITALYKNYYNAVIPIQFQVYTGTTYIVFVISYNPHNKTLYYVGSDANYHSLGKYSLYDSTHHKIKAIIDVANREYVRLHVNGEEIDMAGLSCYSETNTGSARAVVIVQTASSPGNTAVLYVNNYKITYNEV